MQFHFYQLFLSRERVCGYKKSSTIRELYFFYGDGKMDELESEIQLQFVRDNLDGMDDIDC